jgi:hypothetical protein
MCHSIRSRLFAAALILGGLTSVAPRTSAGLDWASATNAFMNPPAEARTRMFWRVFGPAWKPAEIDYQLGLLKDAGIGGVTAFFMYPVELDDAGRGIQNQRFLSPDFLKTLRHASAKAAELHIRFGVAGGTGWPFGGPSVNVEDGAQRLRRIEVPPGPAQSFSPPDLRDGESVFAAYSGTRSIKAPSGSPALLAETPDSAKPLYWFVAGPTRMQVKRPAFGAEGLVVDHINQAAAKRYLDTVVEPMLTAGAGKIESVFCDSLEVYGANWTADFPEAFRRRRGYDLTPLIPALFSTNSSRSADLKFDFWRTHAELTEERFTKTVSEWMHRHEVRFEMEAYGTPPNPLTAARYIDTPAGEQYEWKGFSLSRLAASGAHLTGKNIVSAEAWTWLGLPNRLYDSLSDFKLASDLHFLAGINELIGVDFPYSPRSAGAPGWLPYYGPVMNQNNPQWPWFHRLIDYTSRCQWMLRQGTPVSDVAIYLPVEDIFASGGPDQMLLDFQLRDRLVSGEKTDEFGLETALHHRSDLIHTLLSQGFNYDGIDFFSLEQMAFPQNGRLLAGDGRYRILILPNLTGIDYPAMAKIARFCRGGGTVIATKRLPDRCYGHIGANDTPKLEALMSELFDLKTSGISSKKVGVGEAIFVPDEQESLGLVLARLDPDLRTTPVQPDVGCVHRIDGRRDIYFITQSANKPVSFEGAFRQTETNSAFWDPMTGAIRPAAGRKTGDHHVVLTIGLPPRGSTFVVFDRSTPTSPPPVVLPDRPTGLVFDWNIAFAGTNKPPARTAIRDLVSWTAWPETQFFSGLATYRTEFQWTGPLPAKARLTFSEVHDAAEVMVNGRRAGDVWTPPLEVDIAPYIITGTNTIFVTVGNTPLNGFLGLPDQDLNPLRAAYGNRFPAPEEKRVSPTPAPAGLVGQVELRIAP